MGLGTYISTGIETMGARIEPHGNKPVFIQGLQFTMGLQPPSSYLATSLMQTLQNFITEICKPQCHAVDMHVSATTAFCLVTTLTLDLWPWKTVQQFSLKRWIFLASFTEIPTLICITQHRCWRTDRHPDGTANNIMPPSRVAGGGIKTQKHIIAALKA